MRVWSIEQVVAVAPNARSMTAAETVAGSGAWSATGVDDRVLWGRCHGSGAEPYDTAVDHVEAAWRCSCPSRQHPCKHALGLLLVWIRGGVGESSRPAAVAAWVAGRDRRADAVAGPTDDGRAGDSPPVTEPGARGSDHDDAPPPDLDQARDDRVARMAAALAELDRWLTDRMRHGLADPALARYDTWDSLAARLVDGQAGSLANRIRRLAGRVGASPGWHADVLADMGLLYLLAQAGRRVPDLPSGLADAVAVSVGWSVRQADVLAGVPDTDEWFVAGRSDQREDRIEVRRWWLRGRASQRWAMLLSFAAYGQSLDDTFVVGDTIAADLHRYPGGALRALMGRRDEPRRDGVPHGATVDAACDEIGGAVAAEPWLERFPAIVRATPTMAHGRWVVTDDDGSLPLVGPPRSIAQLVAASAGRPLVTTIEWTPHGVRPLAVHLADRSIDIGPTADPSFVGAN